MSQHEQRRHGAPPTAHATVTATGTAAPVCTDGAHRRDERAIARIVHDVVDRSGQPTCWVVFLAVGDASASFVMAIDDLPTRPDDDEVTAFVQLVVDLVPRVAADEVVVAWERPGDTFGRADWEWAYALWCAFDAARAPLRGQTVVHDRGVAWLCVEPEDAA